MKTLIIYDNTGYIVSSITGSYRIPEGIPYIETEIPDGKMLKSGIGVDITVTPHKVILEDIPPTEIELLKAENESLQATVDAILTDIIPSLMAQ